MRSGASLLLCRQSKEGDGLMDGTRALHYRCRKVCGIDYYREKPEDKDKPEQERRWEVLEHPYILIDTLENLVLAVGTDTEMLERMRWYQQASVVEMDELREQVRKHLAEIGRLKETCTEGHTGSTHGRKWSGLRREK